MIDIVFLKISTNFTLFSTSFVVGGIKKELAYAYADTLNESTDNLHRLVQLIDYTKGYMFSSVRDELGPVILDALHKANIESVRKSTTLLYYMPKEDARKFTTQ